MARNTLNYTVTDEGRDKGKTFVLTEMPASRAEAWAMRAILALLANNVELPDGFERLGMAGMAEVGIKALSGLKWDVAEPLLSEMWDCVQIMPDPSKPHVVRPLIEEDVEEITTRVKIRAEVWKLHTGFLKAVAPSTFGDSPAAAKVKKPSRNT
jgi:hypothetical protein